MERIEKSKMLEDDLHLNEGIGCKSTLGRGEATDFKVVWPHGVNGRE